MIAFVHGMAVDMTESSVVVEAGGIGYEIYMTGADLSEIRMGERRCSAAFSPDTPGSARSTTAGTVFCICSKKLSWF